MSMKPPRQKSILFLCTGNYYRSRFAECLFNSVAGKMGLSWIATSKGLALERGFNNVGPMARSAVQVLQAMGAHGDGCGCDRMPAPAAPDDFDKADRVVALKEAEHRPLLLERFPAWAEKVEYWHVEDDDEALPHVEREVMELIARLTA
jgi:protein-tyrosine-phosphatase